MLTKYIFTVFFIAALAACANVRQLTYPESFVWISSNDVETVMGKFSRRMSHIEQVAIRANPGDAQLIIIELENILQDADSLVAMQGVEQHNQVRTNHLIIDKHLDRFIQNVNQVKYELEQYPNRFYAVGRLVGSCQGCHQFHAVD